MTLVLTCLTDDAVYQVSDRRLTSFTPPHTPIDDESNKAVFVNGRVVFAYTGISQVEGQRTDIWLAHAIASRPSHDMNEIANHVKNKATAAFQHMKFASHYKRHAFQGAGWFSNPSGTSLRPGILTIHNALDPASRDWLTSAKHEFDLLSEFYTLKRNQFILSGVGLRPTPAERGGVHQLLRKCVHRGAGRSTAIIHALALSMRWLSRRYEPNSPIGRSLMAVCLPKVSAELYVKTGKFMAYASAPEKDSVTFLDLPEFRRPVSYGPNTVIGGAVITNFECRPIEHDGNAAS